MSDEYTAGAGPVIPPGDDELEDYGDDEETILREAAHGPGDGLGALELSDRLRGAIRELEKAGCRQPLRHRLALAGMAELDESRPALVRSGAWKLLEAVYEHGEAHWLDPVPVIAPLKEILFKENAPPGIDRGMYYTLTRLARAGISPAAFALHVVMPRMGADYDWRRWKPRHYWVLAEIADMLIGLRANPPWNEARLGRSKVLADVALCKYVGRPLCRLSSERFAGQETHLAAWAKAWSDFTFASPGFLTFMRRTVLPCLYRLSGRIDPEQLAPIATALSGLERTLGRRMAAMSPEAAEAFLASAGLSDSFEERIEKRAGTGSSDAAGSFALAREIKGYAELASALSLLDAGPAVLGRAAALSLRTDPDFLGAAAGLVRALRRDEGADLARWHLEEFAKRAPDERPAYVAAVSAAGGVHPHCPFGRAPAAFERRSFDVQALTLSLGLDEARLAPGEGGGPDLPTMRRAYFEARPDAAELYRDMTAAIARGEDRSWDAQDALRLDTPGPGFHELAIRSLIPGIGTGFAYQNLKAPTMATLFARFGQVSAGSIVALRLRLGMGAAKEAGKNVDAAGRDAARARVAVGLVESAWRAITAKGGDPECGAVFAALGKEAAQARRRLDDMKAAEAPEARAVAALESRLSLMDAAFEAMKDVSPSAGDPRRFALAVHMAAHFFKQGDEAAFSALASASARYARDTAFAAVSARLASDVAPGFMGVEQASLVADAVDALCTACAADEGLAKALSAADRESDLGRALAGSSRLKGGGVSPDSMDAALRRVAAYPRITAETAKWRDLLQKLETAKAPERVFSLYTSRSFLDAYYGDMGGICLSGKPELVERPGVMVCRLWDEAEERVRGMCLFVYSPGPARSAGIGKFWYAFAFNPLRSLTRGMGSKELAALYLGFRAVAEELSAKTGLPVLVPGISTHGVVSNDGAFATLVANYELAAGSPRIADAVGFSVYYPQAAFADALVVIDPRRKGSYRARAELERMGLIR